MTRRLIVPKHPTPQAEDTWTEWFDELTSGPTLLIKAALPVGHISHRAGGSYKKIAPGKWQRVTEGRQAKRSGKNAEQLGHLEEKIARMSPEQRKALVRVWVKVEQFGLPAQTVDAHAKDTGRKNQFGETIRTYTADRAKLHQEISDKAVADVSRVPDSQKPVAIVMMGGGGAGKGTLIRSVVGDHGDFVHVDPDDVKTQMPEYQKAMNLADPTGKRAAKGGNTLDGREVTAKDAAWMAHEESSDVASAILDRAMEGRQNVIVDGTGKNAVKHADKIKELKRRGYHVRLLYAHTHMDEAIKRASERADRSGRFVPVPILHDAHTKIPGNFEFVARHADDFSLYFADRPPKLMWSGGQPPPHDVIHESKMVDEFKELGPRLHAQRGITLPPIPPELRAPTAKAETKPPSLSLDELHKRLQAGPPKGYNELDDGPLPGHKGKGGIIWVEPEYEEETRAFIASHKGF